MRIFTDTLDPTLVLAVCKFLDLILLALAEEFNIYEWIFLSDELENKLKVNSLPLVDSLVTSNASEASLNSSDKVRIYLGIINNFSLR
jgi:hypothetical protein